MKSKFLLLLITVFCFLQSCKKEALTNTVEVPKPVIGFVEQARTFLKANYTSTSLSNLSIDASTLYKLDSGRTVIRVPLKIDGVNNFILLSVDSIKGVNRSVVLNIDKNSNTAKGEKFSGKITIKDLNGKVKEIREIVNGFRIKKNVTGRIASYELPEVIVIAYVYNYDSGYADWFNLLSFFDSNNFGSSNWYEFNGAYTDYGGGSSSYVADPNTLEVNFDLLSGPAIDLAKYFNCFNQIEDIGATFTIQILAQLPVNNDPSIIIENLATGHTFLSVTKSNGGNSITQDFGFYPANGPKSLTLFPVASKIEDNQFTKYNAALTAFNITYDQFSTFMQTAISLASHSYDLNNYNCTNYAVDCFNSIRGPNNKLTIPDFIYNGINYNTTPNKLYELLKTKKNNGDPEAPNIDLGTYNSTLSHGPCN